jgi:hypothetical protein
VTLKRRTTSTIPFGYRESDVEGFLEPIDGQLEALQETKEQLSYKTGRSISAVGLKKIVDKERQKGLLDKRG